MDAGLVAWGRAVKRRRRVRLPVLWLFTDAARLADPVAAVRRLPRGLCGVVFRHDGVDGRAELAARVAAACRARRVAMVMAGEKSCALTRPAGLLGVGVHLRGGRWPGWSRRRRGIVTSSAHDVTEVRRAVRAGAEIVFISPAFATPSHAGEPGLRALRWNNLARHAGPGKAYALGGVDGKKVISLAGKCCGAGAISALL